MRVLVAGGSGVLGRAVIPLLVDAGYEVTATTRSADKAEMISLLGARPALMEALEPAEVDAAVRRASPDAIIDLLTDLACGSSASNAHLRTEATSHLVDAARNAGVHRLIAESIAWAYRPGIEYAAETESLDLEAPEPRQTTIRGVAALESAVRTLPESVILRLGLLYGPGTWYSTDGRYGADARAGTLASTATVASFLHLHDAASAIFAALSWPTGTYNIVDDEPASGLEWVPVFAAAVGTDAPPRSDTVDIGRPVSNTRARAEGLQLEHHSWRRGFTLA